MKAVLISIQPYWVFLIIAKAMGWNISKEKTVEVRKSRPKAESWNKVAKIYCSKDKKSFAKIPKEYQLFMKQLLGKVIGEFVCDEITVAELGSYCKIPLQAAQLDAYELMTYADGKPVYGWHISNLIIYDKPKELDELRKPIECHRGIARENCIGCWDCEITRPPQSWCYVA